MFNFGFLKFLTWVFLGWLISSCSLNETLSLRPHAFGVVPKKIFWFQVPGLSEEHLALVDFGASGPIWGNERQQCLGKFWNFNLYDLRPSPKLGLRSQILGSKNVVGECKDLTDRKPVWDFLMEGGFPVVIMENLVTQEQSIEDLIKCDQYQAPGNLFWVFKRMTPPKKNLPDYHVQRSMEDLSPGIYYDRSCSQGKCFTSSFKNMKAIFERFLSKEVTNLSFFLLRDFTYQEMLKRKDFASARRFLQEFVKHLEFIQKEINPDQNLLLISGTSTQRFEFPQAGNQWRKFNQKGHYALFRRPSLMSPVFSWGASSENFCGLFQESEFAKRILFNPDSQIFGIGPIEKLFD